MGRQHRIEPLVCLTLVVLLAIGSSCSRSLDIPSEPAIVHAGQTPFREDPISPDPSDSSAETEPSAAAGGSHDPGPPFHNEGLPAGTLLSVRIAGPISLDPDTGRGAFTATVDQPVVLDGRTLIPLGSSVAGRIESSRISKLKPTRGYVELALASVEVAGTQQPLRTADLFLRQKQAADGSIISSSLGRGRRLTFRLTAPMYPASRSPHPHR